MMVIAKPVSGTFNVSRSPRQSARGPAQTIHPRWERTVVTDDPVSTILSHWTLEKLAQPSFFPKTSPEKHEETTTSKYFAYIIQ
jgi:hypothetical protein